MANVKITGLTAITAPANTDVLPIVDVSADVTKKVSVADLLESAGDGTAALPAFSFDSEKDIGMFRPGANQLGFATSAVQRLIIDANGYIGINKSSPQEILEVGGSVKLSPGSGAAELYTDLSELRLGVDKNNNNAESNVTFYANNTEKFRVDGSGNIGIGTSTPSAKLEINEATGSSTPAKMRFVNEGDRGITVGFTDHNAAPNFAISNGDQTSHFAVLDGSGRVGIGVSTPSAKLEVNGTATFAGRITNGPAWDTSASLNQAIIDNGTVYTHRQQGTDAVFSAFQGTQGTQNVQIFANGSAVFVGNVDSGALDTGSTTVRGARLNSEGSLLVQRRAADADTTHLLRGFKGTTENVSIFANGNAEFSGNVAIGATSADFKCHITGTGTDLLKIQRSGAGGGAKFRIINGDSNYYDIFHDGAENLTFGYNGSERARISSTGNIGIGTSSPGAKLEISEAIGSSTPAKMKFVNVGERGVTLGFTDHDAAPDFAISSGDQTTHYLSIASSGAAKFSNTIEVGSFASNTAAAVFLGSGAVQAFRDSGVNAATSAVFIGGRKTGSGTESNVSIYANGTVQSGGNPFNGTADGSLIGSSGLIQTSRASGSDVFTAFTTGSSSSTVSIKAGGAATFAGAVTAQSYVTSSDQRFKENITDASSQLADVTALGNKLRNWDWTADAPVADKDTRFLGLVAQEAETICPGIVKTIARTKQGAKLTPETTDEEGIVTPATYEELDDSYKGISNDALIMKLLGAVAELSAKVAALEAG